MFAGARAGGVEVPGCTTVPLDVRDTDSAIRAVAAVGEIDWLVCNAGIHDDRALADIDIDSFKRVLDVNVLGAWRLTRAAIPVMRRGGTVAMISSLSGLFGLPGDGAYAASKFALEGMSQSFASELAGQAIGVCLFEPGAIATGFAGCDDGMSPGDAAIEIVDVLESRPRHLRYPVGDAATRLMAEHGIDRGERLAEVVEQVSGIRLPFAAARMMAWRNHEPADRP